MTTDTLSEPSDGADVRDTVTDGPGRRAEPGQARTVPVMPLWERLGTGVRG
ncbi:hypothetical protein [Streptomyces bullii]|uniref:Uncharacterized protein n=1 Tax=Streptomyces bullii TaxID=349910 RepID=A0ABW0USM6_9ACTN